MKLAVLGRTHWLLDSARRLYEAGHEIALVATGKAAPEYRATEDDFRAFADEVDAAFAFDELPPSDADLAVSVNWPRLLTREQIGLSPQGVVNAHAGDLPRYRGNAAPNWAIINGEDRVGLTLHLMDEGLDSGPVLAKRYFPLGPRTTIGDVYAWLDESIPEMFVDVVASLEAGSLEPMPQDESLALRVPRRRPEDSELEWTRPAVELDRLVRASSQPFAGAFGTVEGRRVTVWRARVEPGSGAPGELVRHGEEQAVATSEGLLVLEEFEL